MTNQNPFSSIKTREVNSITGTYAQFQEQFGTLVWKAMPLLEGATEISYFSKKGFILTCDPSKLTLETVLEITDVSKPDGKGPLFIIEC